MCKGGGVAMGLYATVLFVRGMSDRLADIADLKNDPVGLRLEEEHLPQRIRAARTSQSPTGMDREVFVCVDLDGTPHLMGQLWARVRKDRESATLEYAPAGLSTPPDSLWNLRSPSARALFKRRSIGRCLVRSVTRRQAAGNAARA
jgi:hypothetical protein